MLQQTLLGVPAFAALTTRIANLYSPSELDQLAAEGLAAKRKIDAHTGKQIRVAVTTELVDLGKARNVLALTNHQYGLPLRVGNHRVFFDFDGEARIVSIEEVRKRDERTY